MRTRGLLACVVVACSIAACEGGGACLLDSDCADLSQVCIARRCVPAGTVPDAGAVDAGRRDGGTRTDGGRRDAGTRQDAATDDAGSGDGGVLTCPALDGDWLIGAIPSPPCGMAVAGSSVTITETLVRCTFNAMSPTDPALDGTFTVDGKGILRGMLSTGGDAALECTGSASTSSIAVTCGTCMMELNRP